MVNRLEDKDNGVSGDDDDDSNDHDDIDNNNELLHQIVTRN